MKNKLTPPRIVAYRVQAHDGRGPWRPGWSQRWIDEDAPADRLTETIMDLVPIEQLLTLPSTMAWGCACRTLEALMAWFTRLERERLRAAGFYPVKLNVDVVLKESQWQMLIGRSRPFTDGVTYLRWPD